MRRDFKNWELSPSIVPDCKIDGYPLDEKGDCWMCEQKREDDAKRTAVFITRIGGRKAWLEYTESAMVPTQYNYAALQAAKEFKPSDKKGLFFWGPRGVGKSHMAAIAKRPHVCAGVDVMTISIPEVLGSITSKVASGTFGKAQEEWISRLVKARILSIEDLGVENATAFQAVFMYRVIEGRYKDARSGVIITSNRSLEELEQDWRQYDKPGRTVSRLKEMCKTFSFVGEKDWRAEK